MRTGDYCGPHGRPKPCDHCTPNAGLPQRPAPDTGLQELPADSQLLTAYLRGITAQPGPTLEIVIPGRPVPWARTGGHQGRRYTTHKVRQFETTVARACLVAAHLGRPDIRNWQPINVATVLVIASCYTSKDPAAPFWKANTPDIDNLTKAVSDGLEKGGALANDCKVSLVIHSKHILTDPEAWPRTLVDVWEITP